MLFLTNNKYNIFALYLVSHYTDSKLWSTHFVDSPTSSGPEVKGLQEIQAHPLILISRLQLVYDII